VSARKIVAENFRIAQESRLRQLVVQGKFLEIIQIQDGDGIWKSIMYDLPQKQLAFLFQAAIDAAPSAANLSRWKISESKECKLCGGYETLLHILSNCPYSLRAGKYTWRHDSILWHIVKQFRATPGFQAKIFADLNGCRTNGGGTIPPEFLATAQKPDLVFVLQLLKLIKIFELTSCADRIENIRKARFRKNNRDGHLASDISEQPNGMKATYACFEICALGSIRDESKAVLTELFPTRKIRRKLLRKLAKIAISCSYVIFSSRRSSEWGDVPLFELDVDNN
jgi:hypothetical protein